MAHGQRLIVDPAELLLAALSACMIKGIERAYVVVDSQLLADQAGITGKNIVGVTHIGKIDVRPHAGSY